MTRPVYTVLKKTDKMLLIRDDYDDRNPTMTVTNGAKEVVRELHESGELKKRRLFYQDTELHIDEIVHDGKGGFKGFKAGIHL